jgi:stringent starvation protein B
MSDLSTKPYLIRAIYDWCTDSGFTPYIAVAIGEGVRVPTEYVKNGEIVLNVSSLATNRLKISNDAVEFQARFGGVGREVHVPVSHVLAIYARENGQGMAFEAPKMLGATGVDQPAPEDGPPTKPQPALSGPRVLPALSPASREAGEDGATPPPRPTGGERPKLTRVK